MEFSDFQGQAAIEYPSCVLNDVDLADFTTN